jgi:hypothetical protein
VHRPAGGGGRAQTVCERKLDAWCGRIGERVCGCGSWLRPLARSALAPSILWAADVADEHDLWLHVAAAYVGSSS